MTVVTFTMTREAKPAADGSDPVNAMLAAAGGGEVLNRSRHGPPQAQEWTVDLDDDLSAGRKVGLKTALEASGRCVDVEFP